MRCPALSDVLAILPAAGLGAESPLDIAAGVVADARAPEAARRLGRAWRAAT